MIFGNYYSLNPYSSCLDSIISEMSLQLQYILFMCPNLEKQNLPHKILMRPISFKYEECENSI